MVDSGRIQSGMHNPMQGNLAKKNPYECGISNENDNGIGYDNQS